MYQQDFLFLVKDPDNLLMSHTDTKLTTKMLQFTKEIPMTVIIESLKGIIRCHSYHSPYFNIQGQMNIANLWMIEESLEEIGQILTLVQIKMNMPKKPL